MIKSIIWLLLLQILVILIVGCNSADNERSNPKEEEQPEVSTEVGDSITEASDTLSEALQGYEQNLENFFSNPLKFPAIKKDIHFLEMGTCLAPKYMHPIEEGYYNYNYGTCPGLLFDHVDSSHNEKFNVIIDSFPMSKVLMSFSTYKPWVTAQDRYYSNNNEIIVGCEVMVGYEGLEPYNFVGKTKHEVIELFGENYFSKQGCIVYLREGKILVLRIVQGKVTWFKYYWLNSEKSSLEDLPDTLFRWTLHS